MKRSTRNILALAAFAALSTSIVGAETVRLASSDSPLPGGGNYSIANGPVINNAAQVAFDSALASSYGVFRITSGGPVTLLAREGGAAPGGGLYRAAAGPVISPSGQVMYFGEIQGSGATALFRSDGISPVQVARSGTAAPGGGNYTLLDHYGINQFGEMTFIATTTTTPGLFFSDGGTPTALARGGGAAPGGGNYTTFNSTSINLSGVVAFHAQTTTGDGIYRADIVGPVTNVARFGGAAPGGGTFSGFNLPTQNNNGIVGFSAFVGSSAGLFYGNTPGTLIKIVRSGEAAPGGGTFGGTYLKDINDSNQGLFQADVVVAGGLQTGVFRGDGLTPIRSIARTNDPAPDGNGQFESAYPLAINATGLSLFSGELKNTTGGLADNAGLFLGDGTERITVARYGQPVDGSTIQGLVVAIDTDSGGRSALNDFGQVTYSAMLANGKHGLYLFTPDLHWRNPSPGAWDEDSNWTVSIKPTAIHAVIIDPQSGTSINGPAGNVTIKSLVVGARTGSSNATLLLDRGGTLTTLQDSTVRRLGSIIVESGMLAVQGRLTNDGDLGADTNGSITTTTGIVNSGVIALAGGTLAGAPVTNTFGAVLFGNGTIAAPLTNFGTINTTLIPLSQASSLRIASLDNHGLVQLHQLMNLNAAGGSISNSGRILLNGGSITGGSLVNNSAGIIDAPAATSPTPSGIGSMLTNHGIIHVGANASLLVSNFSDNFAGGQIRIDDNGTLNSPSPSTNAGLILLGGNSATLSGGQITNTGTIQGIGTVANPLINDATIRAEGGRLVLSGTGAVNTKFGEIQSGPGSSVTYLQGLALNEGTIALSGGTFDNNNQPLDNEQFINGHGTFRSGDLTNNDLISVADGPTSFYGPITNKSSLQITNNTTTFFGPVNNDAGATIKTTSAVARFLGTFTNTGTYNSDPSDNYFFDVNLAGGSWTGGVGDRFFVKGLLNWTAGSMVGAGGATYAQGTTSINDAAVKTLNAWTFHNEKPLTLSGGNIDMGNGAVINNTNTFDIQSDASIVNTLGDSATFSNTATLRKSGGTGTSTIAARVNNNNGTIDVQTGTLDLQGGLNIAAGTSLNKNGLGTLRVAGPQPHGANANLTASAGTIRLASNAGTPATAAIAATKNLALNITGNNAAVILDSHQDVRELDIPFASAGNQSLDLNSPAAPGAFNAIRVYAADLAAAKTALWSALKSGLSGPDGIFDSGRAAHAGSGIALARINDAHGDAHVQLRLARIGDLNLDGNVSIADFISLASNFNSSGSHITWQEGDLNYDSAVSIADFIALAANFNSSYSGGVAPLNPDDYRLLANFASGLGVDTGIIGSAVPEPAGMAVLGMAAVTLLTRRSRRRRYITSERSDM